MEERVNVNILTKFQVHWTEIRTLGCSFFVPMFELVTPGAEPVLILEASNEQTW